MALLLRMTLVGAIVATGCSPAPQPQPPSDPIPTPTVEATSAPTTETATPTPTSDPSAASDASTAPTDATCKKKEVGCEHSELAKLIAVEWHPEGRPPDHDAKLEAALRAGPLYVRKGGPEAFSPCIAKTPFGVMALNKDAPMGMPDGSTDKKACLIVYTDVETAASDCHLETEQATIAQLAKFAQLNGMGISVTCKQFTKTIYPEQLDSYMK